ncbi:hypothetical protein, partial [Bifidobacterium longum]|uniref:hypothetical protein n=1 Tax=Bifidobacterium longum TaxID=216816 RepID=UPI002990193C
MEATVDINNISTGAQKQVARCLNESATPVGLEIVRITSPKGCRTYGGKACSHLSEEERQVIRIEV